MNIQGIQNIKNLKGKKVIVRLDFDVPIEGGEIRDDLRIRSSLKTLEYLRRGGARMILIGHIGRDPKNSLRTVYGYLEKLFPLSGFITDYFSVATKTTIDNLSNGDAVMFENLRQHPEEEKNDENFAKKLASLADVYIDESFAVSHRAHASIIGIPKFIPGYAGFVLQDEVKHLSLAFKPPRPFLFVLGGAKFETKIPLIRKFLKTADHVFVGGALANNYFKEKGYEIGTSVVSEGDFGIAPDLQNPKLILPFDVVAYDGAKSREVVANKVLKSEKIFDAGPQALAELGKLIKTAKFILWNGPLGNYEKGFDTYTLLLTKMIAESSAETIVGGGDTIASIAKLGLDDEFSFVSTGGGAMLEFLANETLPGIEALGESPKSLP